MDHFKRKPVLSDDAIILKGEYHPYKDWKNDFAGYVLIRVNKEKNLIEFGFCKKDNIIDILITGKTPQEIYYTVCEKGILSRSDHIAYVGRELQKAYLALKYDLDYVQDEELDLENLKN